MTGANWSGTERDLTVRERRAIVRRGICLARLLRLWGATWRLSVENIEKLQEARESIPSGSIIYAFWHNRMVMLTWTHRGQDARILMSSSRDGRLLAALAEHLGHGTVIGSSSRGGAAGLRRLVRLARAGRDTALAVDGPRGPRGRLKPGVLQVAALAGAPVVPLAVSARPVRILGTWDRTLLPLPFARLRLRYGEALAVPRGAGREELAALQDALEVRLRNLTDGLDAELGLEPIPPDPAGEAP
ncbi:MAG: lysophospholipid acyltransferase family protein [Candidatus Krumholzibacteriota bacterium]|nr:lysophospholipid acyltransferase family protein [Candidatus Krumholzibacteriota bacterium]